MRALLWWVAVSALVALAACGRPVAEEPAGGDQTQAQDPAVVTLQTIGGEDWPVGEEGYATQRPAPPPGFTEQDVAELAQVLEAWSKATSLDPSAFSGDDPGSPALAPLGHRAVDSLLQEAADAAVPELHLANAWDEVADYEAPRMTTAWSAQTVAVDDDPMLMVTLQARAFYPVTTLAGEQTLIAVVRWHRLASFGDQTPRDDYTGSGEWAVDGVDECAVLERRTLVPLAIAEHADDEYERHVAAMNDPGIYAFEDNESDDIDSPRFAEQCAAATP